MRRGGRGAPTQETLSSAARTSFSGAMGRGGAGRGARKGEAAPAAKGDGGTAGSKGRGKGRRGDEGDRASQQAGKGVAASSGRKTSQKKKEPDQAKSKLAPEEPGLWQALEKLALGAGERADAEEPLQAANGAAAQSGKKGSQKEPPDQGKAVGGARRKLESTFAPEEPGANDIPSLIQALAVCTISAEERPKAEAANGAAAPSGKKGSQKEPPDQGKAVGGARRKLKSTFAPEEPGANDIPSLTQALGMCTISAEERPKAEAANGAAAPSGKKASRKEKGAQKAREAEQAMCALVKLEPAPRGSAVVAPNKLVASQKAKPLPKEEEEVGQPGKESASAGRRDSRKTEQEKAGKEAGGRGTLLPKEPGPRGNRSLRQVLEKLRLAKEERSKAAQLVNMVRDILVKAIKREACFSCVEVLGTGSYYEHLKISNPNEFDIMLKVPDMRVELESCNVPASGAFFYVKLKRNPGEKAYLAKFLDDKMHLSSSDMLSALRNIIVEEVKKKRDLDVEVHVERKKPGCPAVTLLIGKPPSVISVDIILALEFRRRAWCESTRNGLDITGWLGRKVKNAFLNEPLYLVPKIAKDGKCLIENTWRLSFSHIEKAIMTNHGNSKTCCEKNGQKCCRKDCLKLLKYLLEQLKTKHENRNQFEKFHSYLAKTAFLHACTKWSRDDEWLAANLHECFNRLLDYFVGCLRAAELKHFFIPEFNLLQTVEKTKCNALAKVIESEQNTMFPIFSL
ncbi:Mab-21 domain-containing protein [Podarcis lilfordi]|uniref:Mab-21 domain-containing protein n=1 Tax=Podarcis lilfordi TaxID=74358 RepID=A0AA35K1Z0_9SAUR|nr:Mab-21 domain-containing protein [Podarcis lilfordi]